MKLYKKALFSAFFITILVLQTGLFNPTSYAKESGEPLALPPNVEESEPTDSGQPSESLPESTMLDMLKSYEPKQKIDPGIQAEIVQGAADLKVIVFFDISVKSQVISSLPPSVKVRSDFDGALPFLSMMVPADLQIVEAIATAAGVKGVYLDRALYPLWVQDEQLIGFDSPYEGVPPFLLNQSTEIIGAQNLWNMNITGNKVVIAITDTGINKYHPDFYFPETGENKVIFEYVCVDGNFDGIPDVGPEDVQGHGTHCASTAAGTGRTGGASFFYDSVNGSWSTTWLEPGTGKGVAPDAYLMNIKISHTGGAYTSWMMEGYVQAVLHGADVISTSFGGHFENPEWDFPFIYTTEWATQNGVVVVAAAGNEGPDFGTIGTPGHSDSIITVGATTKLDRVASFSSRGPSTPMAVMGAGFLPFETPMLPSMANATAAGALKTKPDIVAPGVSISAAYTHYEETEYWHVFEGAPAEGLMYIAKSGTSMATPHVAGAAALLLESFPGAVPAAVKVALLQGADDLGLDPNVQGFGRMNVSRAYEIMSAAGSVASSIEAPRENIPAEPSEFGPYPYFTDTDILVEDRISNFESFANYLTTLEADNASLSYVSDELFDPTATVDGWDDMRIESTHPYIDNDDSTWVVEKPGAQQLELYFPKIFLADAGDSITVTDKYGITVWGWWITWSGPAVLYDQWVTVPGDQAFIRFVTDGAGVEWGFRMDGYRWRDAPKGRSFIYSTDISNPTYNDPWPETAISVESPHNYLDREVILPTPVESDHPYSDNYFNEWTITEPGASAMRIRFTQLTLESNFRDYIRILDKDRNQWGPTYTGDWGGPFWTGLIIGDTVIIQMVTDETVHDYFGFRVDRYRYYSNYETTITVPDGARLQLHFEQITLAWGDYIEIRDTEGNVATLTFWDNGADYWLPTVFRGDGCTLKISITLYPNGDGIDQYGFKIDRYRGIMYDYVFYEEGAGLILLHFDKIQMEPGTPPFPPPPFFPPFVWPTAGDFIEIKANKSLPTQYWRSMGRTDLPYGIPWSGFSSDDFWLPVTPNKGGEYLKIAIITDNDGVIPADAGYHIDKYAVWYDSPSAKMLSNYDAFFMLEPTSGGPTFKVLNGGFEAGDLTDWEYGGVGDHRVVSDLPGSGTYSALLGFRESPNIANNRDWMYQTVKVPAGAQHVLLSFQYRMKTWDDSWFDRFEVEIRDEFGNWITTVTWDGGTWAWFYEDLGWKHVTYDLTPFAGQTIQLYFELLNGGDTLLSSWVYVDDVSVNGQYVTDSALHDYVTVYGGNLLITGDWADMIPKPDAADQYTGYDYYTRDLGIMWNDTVGGGYTTNIQTHAITTNVTTLYFGGPLASLIPGTGATTVVYDPYLPGVCTFEQTGKVVAISDDDVLSDLYLTNPMHESDNLRLGLNIVAWFAGVDPAIFDEELTEEIHDIALGVMYPVYIINGTDATIDLNVHNLGNYTETTIHAWLQIRDPDWTITYNLTQSVSPAGGFLPGATETITFTVPTANISCREDLHVDSVYIWGIVSLWSNFTSPYGEDWPINNDWPWWMATRINIVDKNPRTGVNPILSIIAPASLNSYTSPFVAAFPGDWKPLNVTFATSGNLVDGTMNIEGDIADIADFYYLNYTTGSFDSLGDTKNITLKDMSKWQHTTEKTVTRFPTGQFGSWVWGWNGFWSDNLYAFTATPNAVHTYRNYNFGFSWDASITKVEVGIEAFSPGAERIGVYVSKDGGATWSSEHIIELPGYDTHEVVWLDFTNVTWWTPSKLSNPNFRVRVEHEVLGTPSTTYLDWIPVRVTYTSSVMLSPYPYSWSSLLYYPPYIIPSLNSTGHAFGYMEIYIPEDAQPGTYTGSVTVYNGTTSITSMLISIEVKTPLSKLLYDDLGHYWLLHESIWSSFPYNYKFLWSAYYDAWVKAAQWGFDIDSLILTAHSMKMNLEETFKEEMPWRYATIADATFTETFSQYSAILEFNNALLDLWGWWFPNEVYYRPLDEALHGYSYVNFTLLDVYDLILKAGGNLAMLADEDPFFGHIFSNMALNFLGTDIYVTDNPIFNWTITRECMEDFPHWITHDVENFTMAGWSLVGSWFGERGGYFLEIPTLDWFLPYISRVTKTVGTTAVLTDMQSPHPYPSNYDHEWNITVPGADAIRVHFKRIDTEEGAWESEERPDYRDGDWVTIYDNQHTVIDSYSGIWDDPQGFWTSWVPGDIAYISLNTDLDLQFWGFKIDMYEYLSEDGVQVLAMGTQPDEWDDFWGEPHDGWEWGPIMAVDEHLTGSSPSTWLPYTESKVFVLGEGNQFENLFLEYQDWLTSDYDPYDRTAGYEESRTWTIDTLLHNILAYMSDKTAPTTDITYSDPSHTADETLYVSDNTLFSLPAVEAVTEVDSTHYKIDEEAWTTYTDPFSLAGRSDGDHTIYYYSVDGALNKEPEKSQPVVLDTTPPNVTIESMTVTPGLTTSSMTVTWTASDSASGISHFEISVDNQTAWVTVPGNETSYTFGDLGDGSHTAYLRAIDNVDNVGAVDEDGNIVGEISSVLTIQSLWPYVAGGIIIIVIIGAAAYFMFIRKKTTPGAS